MAKTKMSDSEYRDIQDTCQRIKDDVYNANWSSDAKARGSERTNAIIENLEAKYGYDDERVGRIKDDMEWYRHWQ